MSSIIFQIAGGALSFWLAVKFVPGVEFSGEFKYLIMAGAFLGLVNFFIRPILRMVTLPLRIITLGLFGLVIDMAIIWLISIFFPELVIAGLIPLFWTTLIVWLVGHFLGFSSFKR
jgi:putative membrane protein